LQVDLGGRYKAVVLRVANVVGTRPNLVKMSAVLAAQRARPQVFAPVLIHTGQHRAPAMSERLFPELELPPPDIMLSAEPQVGGQATQIGRMLIDLEPVLAELRPDVVVVVGDVNSTVAAALAAAALGVPVAHVEAGLRNFDRTMPEEINRVLVDMVSELLFASEESAVANLLREGRPAPAIHHVGNVMIDALVRFQPRAAERHPAAALGIAGEYGVLTLHRPSNVDRAAVLRPLLRSIATAARRLPIVFPVHPRTRDRLDALGLAVGLAEVPGLVVTEPLGYVDMLALMRRARLVLTDSGGVQEETTYLGVPCLTLRDNTERPATVTHGTNRVVGTRAERVLAAIEHALETDPPRARCPPLWDGQAAHRVIDVLGRIALGSRIGAAGA
jgi:UDP-N-acetylglucosamine 2-epimerase (non-hydrolysing)